MAAWILSAGAGVFAGCGSTNASNVNFTAGVNIANTVIVQPSSMGEICVFNSVDVDMIIDVSGYFPPV